MTVPRLRTAALALAATFALSGCYDDGYGYYGGLAVGYGPGYYDPYYDFPSYYGWYDGFYYPGTGYFVYDRWGHRYRWNDHDRRYWEGQRDRWERQGGWRDHDHGQWQGGTLAPDRHRQAHPPRAMPRREGRGPRGDRPGRVHED